MTQRNDTSRVHDRSRDQRTFTAGRAGLLRRVVDAGRKRMAMGEFAPANVFAMLLFGVLAIALFLALAGGTAAYERIADDDQAARDMRMGTSLIANTVRAVDAVDAVTVGEGPEGRALVLVEHLDSGTFETRLYLHDGWIVEEYAVAGSPYDPPGAVQVAASETFSFEVQPNAVRIDCDEGRTVVALRADGAVADEALLPSDAADGYAAPAGAAAGGAAGASDAAEGGE